MRAGVVVTDSANPTLALNIIRDGKHAGLLIRHTATGRFRQNTVSHNAHGNVVLLEQVSSELVANIISHGPLGGIIIRGTSKVIVRGNTICHNDGANIAVLDNSDPICDGNCLTNGAGRGLVIMDNAKGTYRFNMIRDSELAGVYVGRQASPEMVCVCVCLCVCLCLFVFCLVESVGVWCGTSSYTSWIEHPALQSKSTAFFLANTETFLSTEDCPPRRLPITRSLFKESCRLFWLKIIFLAESTFS